MTIIAAKCLDEEPMKAGSSVCACMKPTSGCSIHPNTPDEWIASQAASLAKILARLDAEQALPANGPDFGPSSPASFAQYDPATHSLKTAQCSLFEDSMSSSVTLPRWGSMRNGRLYPQPMPVLRISGRESGFWPTIRCTDGERGGRGDLIQAVKGKPNSHYRLWQMPVADDCMDRAAGKFNSRGEPKLSAQVKLWPTPTKSDGTGGPGNSGRDGGLNLRTAVNQWPTPTVHGNHNRKGASVNSGDGLATAVKLATPTARDWKSGKASQVTMERNSRPLSEQIGGSLNPTWVEWLMGWPIGHTALKHWVTARSRSRRPSPGKSCTAEGDDYVPNPS